MAADVSAGMCLSEHPGSNLSGPDPHPIQEVTCAPWLQSAAQPGPLIAADGAAPDLSAPLYGSRAASGAGSPCGIDFGVADEKHTPVGVVLPAYLQALRAGYGRSTATIPMVPRSTLIQQPPD